MTTSSAPLDARRSALGQIREQFPALRRTHAGLPVAYFDGPGGTQVPLSVGDAMLDYLYYHNANTHWQYPSSAETDEALAAARVALGDFLNARPEEIAFGANMTTLTFHLARALGRGMPGPGGRGRPLGPGDEIVVTELDHHANVAPWRALAVERGVTVRTARLDVATGRTDWDDLARCIGPRTRILAVGAASNALGTITDVAAAARLAHAVGALVFVDAVHYAPHELVDVRAMGCDFLACSSYKFYGPHLGVLYGRRDYVEQLDAPKLIPAPDETAERLETGTQNHEGIVGAAAAVDFLASLGDDVQESVAHGIHGIEGDSRRARLQRAFAGIGARKKALFARLWDGLGAIPGVTRYGPPAGDRRTPTAAFTVRGQDSDSVARALAERALFVSSGDFYAATVVERLGLVRQGLVRLGCAVYTSEEEIDRVLDGVASLAR
jgi:cysteine desulfurase family protein (TIGR01976 family)